MNLKQQVWSILEAATNGVYNNTNGTHHLFFRIRAIAQ